MHWTIQQTDDNFLIAHTLVNSSSWPTVRLTETNFSFYVKWVCPSPLPRRKGWGKRDLSGPCVVREVWCNVAPSTPRALDLLSRVKKKTLTHELTVLNWISFISFYDILFSRYSLLARYRGCWAQNAPRGTSWTERPNVSRSGKGKEKHQGQ